MTHSLVTLVLSLLVGFTLSGCQNPQPNQLEQISHKTDKNEWVSLFNGKNLDGWVAKFKHLPAGKNYKNTFRVEEGLLTVSYNDWEYFPENMFGHLFTKKSYSNYRLRVEYRFIGEQIIQTDEYRWAFRNNGLMLHSPPAEYMELEQEFPQSGEAQLLGGNGKDPRSTGNFCSPSTHIVKDGKLITEHCIHSNSKTYHGDQWVWFEIEAKANGNMKHFVNGELVFKYDEMQVDPDDKYGRKWLAQGGPLTLNSGHISIQAETHPIQFRTIEIKSLN